jgi:hypothetical protein
MDPVTTLTCEYIFEQDECIEYLKCTNNKHIDYAHIYQMHNYTPTFDKKKKVRKICVSQKSASINCVDLSGYTNLIQVLLDEGDNKTVILPQSVTCLDFWTDYARKLFNFPPNLIHLDIGTIYEYKLPELTKLRTLRIGGEYKYKIKFPKTLRHLTWFNYNDVPQLPLGLTHLAIMIDAIPALLKVIPGTLTHLEIEDYSTGDPSTEDSSTEDILYTSDIPDTITHLTWNSIKSLPGLHDKLIYLSLEENMGKESINLPNSITHLIISCSAILASFPTSLIYLKWACNRKAPDVPNTLKYLIVSDRYICGKFISYTVGKIKIPLYLKHLKWLSFTQLPSLPRSLHTLILYSKYNYDITTLPSKLTCLKLYCNKRLPALPNTLITLKLKDDYTHKLPVIPSVLTRLIISRKYKYINKIRQTYSDRIIYDY